MPSRPRRSVRLLQLRTMPSSSTKPLASLLLSLQPLAWCPRRAYATATPPNDPYRWPPSAYPTPYEIFELPPGAPYSKRRYVELVKLYHPDLGASCPHVHLTPELRTDRFCLIVAAHSILSDASKRAAYDRFGVGWQHRHRPTLAQSGFRDGPATAKWWAEREGFRPPAYAHVYGTHSRDDPANNATWEDWEQWYQRRAYSAAASGRAGAAGVHVGGQQEEIYTDNRVFIMAVVLFALAGAFAEVKFANATGTEIMDYSDKQSQELRLDMDRRRDRAVPLNELNKEERIERFLRIRDPKSQYGMSDTTETIKVEPHMRATPRLPVLPLQEDSVD